MKRTISENLKILIAEYPEHGILTLNGQQLMANNFAISLLDLEKSRFVYQHGGNNAEFDRFSFSVSDGVHVGYYFEGM